jgi:hypothetical protein
MSYRITGEDNDPSAKVLSMLVRLNLHYFDLVKIENCVAHPTDLLPSISAAYQTIRN